MNPEDEWVADTTPHQLSPMPPVHIVTADQIAPLPPLARPPGQRFDVPTLSVGVEPDRTSELVPADPRMHGWRLHPPRNASPVKYSRRPANGEWFEEGWWEDVPLLWEHPVTGEYRRCPAAPLGPWLDPWAEDTRRCLDEVRRRACTCNADQLRRELGLDAACSCGDPTGWNATDTFWFEQHAPVPARRRALPAQYPMSTRRSRLRDWWWRMTHRVVDSEVEGGEA